MGLDAKIYFSAEGPIELEEYLPLLYRVVPADEWGMKHAPGVTHEIDCNQDKYYSVDYERGPWPDLCLSLMLLLACPGVKNVWYGSDMEVSECTPDDVLDISKHFMEHGEDWFWTHQRRFR